MYKQSPPRSPDPQARKRQRGRCRRPISDEEAQDLEAFGASLRLAREAAGLSQIKLARLAGYGDSQVQRLEAATRRPRRSSIERLAEVIVEHAPSFESAADLTDVLAKLAGIGLAPESDYADKIAASRARRLGKRDRKAARAKAKQERLVARLREEARQERLWRAEQKKGGTTRPNPRRTQPKPRVLGSKSVGNDDF